MSQSTVPDIHKLVQLIEETVSQESTDSSRIMAYLKECAQLGVEVLPLDINMSGASCSIEDEKNIRIGFSLLVSGEEQFIEDILAERQQNGQFQAFQDFCERIDLDSVSEDFITRCIQVGAFDSIEPSRSRLFLGREKIMYAVRKANAEKSAGQFSLFAAHPTSSKSQSIPIDLPDAEEWTEEELITHEKEAMGFSFTEHLFRGEDENSSEGEQSIDEEPPLPPVEFTPANEFESSFSQGIETRETTSVTSPEEDLAAEETEVTPSTFVIQLSTAKTAEQTLLQLREIVKKYPGNSRVMLEFIDDKNNKTHIRAHTDYSVHISDDLVKEMEAVLGERTTQVQS